MKIVTGSAQSTKHVAKKFSSSLTGGDIVCLQGDLGAGKTTFTQGLLETFNADPPYTSPTFVILKEYTLTPQAFLDANLFPFERLYHIDAYRIKEKDLSSIGWEDLLLDKKSLTLIEWPENIQKALPQKARWIYFQWISENERSITIKK